MSSSEAASPAYREVAMRAVQIFRLFKLVLLMCCLQQIAVNNAKL